MAERAGAGHDREQNSRDDRDARVRDADLLDVEREHRTVAPIHELQRENHEHHQHEILEREHAAKRHSLVRGVLGVRRAVLGVLGVGWIVSAGVRVRRAVVVHHEDDGERDGVKNRCHDERAAQPDEVGQRPADDRSDARTETLGRLHEADRVRHPIARRRFGGHRHRQRSVAGEQPLHRAQREDVPRARHVRHRRHDQHEAHERSLDHDLAAVPIAERAPRRREQRGQARRDREAHAGPNRDLADVGDAELADVERQKRHRQRESRVPHETRRRHGVHVSLPRTMADG